MDIELLKLIKLFLIFSFGLLSVHSKPMDKYYKFGDFGTIFIEAQYTHNWFGALNDCASRNMTLIAIDTPEKNSLLTEILRNASVNISLWLGGHDQAEEGIFVWASTGKRFDFSNWRSGNPDNDNKAEHCAFWDVNNFEWNDGSCWVKMGYICEENRFLIAARKDLEIKHQFIEQLFTL